MAIKDLKDLMVHTMQDIYYAENRIAEALPKMAQKADDPQLRAAFERHLEETRGQIRRLDQAFQALGEQPKGERCDAIEGIIKEAEKLMGEIDDKDTRDAAMIAAAQAVEHYEITRYGTIISWAEMLKLDQVSNALRDSLDEEKDTDARLTRIAEDKLNRQAA